MEIITDLTKLDNRIILDNSGVFKKIYKFRPKTKYNVSYPVECLKSVGVSLNGNFKQVITYSLDLNILNLELNSNFASINDFLASLNNNEYLLI